MPREVTGLSGSPCWKMPSRDQEKEPEQFPLMPFSEKRAKQFTAVNQGESWPPSITLPGHYGIASEPKSSLIGGRPKPQPKLAAPAIGWGSEEAAMTRIWGCIFPGQIHHLGQGFFVSSICSNSGTGHERRQFLPMHHVQTKGMLISSWALMNSKQVLEPELTLPQRGRLWSQQWGIPWKKQLIPRAQIAICMNAL